ncbi:hypothetical protein DSM21852_11710 [Methylocystis bryophila]|uniref:Uncharacterized protein n=1 Tax=Methylocystis bryophila TaxID=655015 RepID=A0A1W6MW84_9HYPH|nr:hypothetical protein B1812_12980 [Methylocystis bryophila]BDV37918.1 hypothetical protein DSM21852_11710 [Methylocystis bryophila]
MPSRRVNLLTPEGQFDRAAIMRKAWPDFRRVRAAGGCGMCFADFLRNAWRVAKAQRAPFVTWAVTSEARERRWPQEFKDFNSLI